MTLPQPVADLVDRFHRNRDAYLSGQYNETQVRREFIDPMFKELGWDMDNTDGYAEAYKDVIHEDAIKVGGATKARPVFRTTAENGRLPFPRRRHAEVLPRSQETRRTHPRRRITRIPTETPSARLCHAVTNFQSIRRQLRVTSHLAF
jgi:hypothetical protein